MDFDILVCNTNHLHFAPLICDLIAASAKARGTGIAKRSPTYIRQKIEQGNAVIALQGLNLAGFCYIEQWSHGEYIANSGLIVAPSFRKQGLAKQIKQAIFKLSQKKYPAAKLFGITTSLAVMKINASLGYQPVTFSELTQEEAFWQGCQSCPNYDILMRNKKQMCLCTAMLAPAKEQPAIDLSHQILNHHV